MRRTTVMGRGAAAVASAMVAGVLAAGSWVPMAQAAANPAMLQTRAYLNDPRATGDESNVPRNLVIHHFDHAPRGAWERAVVWNLSDDAIADAMIRAHRRGVHVRVIMANTNCHERLKAALAAGSGSSLTCVVHSSRSAGGTMHQKSYTFSAVGGASQPHHHPGRDVRHARGARHLARQRPDRSSAGRLPRPSATPGSR